MSALSLSPSSPPAAMIGAPPLTWFSMRHVAMTTGSESPGGAPWAARTAARLLSSTGPGADGSCLRRTCSTLATAVATSAWISASSLKSRPPPAAVAALTEASLSTSEGASPAAAAAAAAAAARTAAVALTPPPACPSAAPTKKPAAAVAAASAAATATCCFSADGLGLEKTARAAAIPESSA